ncbi:glycosyltransferase [Magnetospirillum sp. SS-4]|uniref:glycosyltransferase family protein n=1 Tax=Magnetospirillum sp. SS-4 TaxID=2681465 RepID=UPI00137C9FA2|nr:glycosyltransferase [Magnetospirillum sp. SS-4]CAA7620709.1 conserved hypothetical protein [Magnetospirillum sp. SS-4]
MPGRDRINTLYLHANGDGMWMIKVDTILRGILGYGDGAQPPLLLRRSRKVNAYFRSLEDRYAPMSYIADWREAFCQSPRLRVDVCNINNLVEYAGRLLRIRDYDLIVISHAAAGDDLTVLLHSTSWLSRRRGKLVMFIGNEYALMDQKIAVMRRLTPDLVCSQLPREAAQHLYGDTGARRIVPMPHALNPDHYRHDPASRRETDIGFIGDIYPPFIGDRERTAIIEWFENHGPAAGVVCDIRKRRVGRRDWAAFLNGCKAVIGAEAGSYYLNDDCRLLEQARQYSVRQGAQVRFDDVFERFFKNAPRLLSGKAISSRHFEPIGTRTCQILLEGGYNGILEPEIHYIAVKKDLSDVHAAIERFRDATYRARITDQAYDHVMSGHTYAHRVNAVIDLLS